MAKKSHLRCSSGIFSPFSAVFALNQPISYFIRIFDKKSITNNSKQQKMMWFDKWNVFHDIEFVMIVNKWNEFKEKMEMMIRVDENNMICLSYV